MKTRRILKIVYLPLLVASILLVSSDAFAQPQEDQASSGTLMAAALETAGYVAQSIILRDFALILEELAALVLIGAVIGGMISFLIMGSYRVALWFFIGPALFFFVTRTTVIGYGAEWQFGTSDDITYDVGLAINEPVNARVSWLFDRYNRLISSVIQNMITVISHDETRNRMMFMARQQIMDLMLRAQITSPELENLIQFSFAHCNDALDAARVKAVGERDAAFRTTVEYNIANSEYTQLLHRRDISIRPGITYTYLERLLSSHLDAGLDTVGSEPGQFNSNAYQTCLENTANVGSVEQVLDHPVSCHYLWCWMGLGFQNEVQLLQEQAEEEHISPDANAQLRREIWQDIMIKLSDSGPAVGPDPSVAQIQPDVSLIPVIIGGYMLRKQLSSGNMSQGMQQFAEHSGVELKAFDLNIEALTPEQHHAFSQRFMSEQMSAAKRWEVFTLAMTLPYIQGALLYTLALTFPFFAIMLVIPGQAGSFFQWAALWAWTKFWDLGWAFVMVVDDILWSLMPHNDAYDPNLDPNLGPESVMAAAFSNDPSYSLSFYYMIISALLVAVPIVSAQAILGAKAVIANTLMNGMKGLSERMGMSASSAAAVKQTFAVSKMRQRHNATWGLDGKGNPGSFKGEYSQPLLDAANRADAAGDKLLAASGAAIGATAAAMAISAPSVVGPALLGSAGGKAAYNTWKAGRDLKRVANNARGSWRRAYQAERLFATKDTKTDRLLLSTLGAIKSGRSSHIFVRESPDGIAAEVANTSLQIENTINKAEAQVLGSTTLGPAGDLMGKVGRIANAILE